MESYNILLISMAIIALIVFVCLYFVEAGYGMLFDKKWGLPINNKLAWVLMETPVFITMLVMWVASPVKFNTVPLIFFLLFELHYFQRSFIFPFKMSGKSKMPIGIMLMGVVFNVLNGYIQGKWLFYLAPADMYVKSWLTTPQFIIGVAIFIFGMAVNWHSDHIVRNLRKPGDTNHYLPKGGMFNYVTSANYFGEFIEWCGFAIMTWSWAGALFAVWTFANLAPRANTINKRYQQWFPEEMKGKNLMRIIPFIY